MSLYRCDACGVHLPYGACKTKIGGREFCGPAQSPCHRAGLRSASWTFTATDAAELLADDIDELRRRGVRSVDPHHHPAFLESPKHVAA